MMITSRTYRKVAYKVAIKVAAKFAKKVASAREKSVGFSACHLTATHLLQCVTNHQCLCLFVSQCVKNLFLETQKMSRWLIVV